MGKYSLSITNWYTIVLIIFMIIIIGLLASSCSPQRYIRKNEVKIKDQICPKGDTLRIYRTDTLFKESKDIPQEKEVGDSTYVELLFKCDSNNKVLIEELNTKATGKTSVIYKFKDNKLVVQTYQDSILYYKKTEKEYRSKTDSLVSISDTYKFKADILNEEIATLKEKVRAKNKSIFYFSLILFVMGLIFYYKVLRK
jgi:hypothetical protein